MKKKDMMTPRVYNFGAGPAALPESVLLDAQHDLLNWQEQGMSVMEIGHRTSVFTHLMEDIESDLRDILSIPQHYHVLFLGGAARTQFAMIPMNLIAPGEEAGYVLSGVWSSMAYEEACHLEKAYVVAGDATSDYKKAPDMTDLVLKDNTSYVYFTPNETINGVVTSKPDVGHIPVIADMTSCLLGEPIRVEEYGLIFAGAQKNIAPAGLTILIIRDDLLPQSTKANIPTMLNYNTHIKNHSLYATPPTFNCYMAGKMFQWIKAQGGISALYKANCKKAQLLYDYIDSSAFYHCVVEKESRSLMNACFTMQNKELESDFIIESKRAGFEGLKGHRVVGGLRASMYNAMPIEGVEKLIAFMQHFAESRLK